MKPNTNYLKSIADKLGAETMSNRTSNYYLRKIFEKLDGSASSRKSDNQYLKYISENINSGGGSCDVTADFEMATYSSFPFGITSITVPNGIKSIGNQCFAYLTGLEEVTLPSTITSIGNNIFQYDDKLEKVNLNWAENPVEYSDGKMQIRDVATFTIPKGTTDVYTSANYPTRQLVEREE